MNGRQRNWNRIGDRRLDGLGHFNPQQNITRKHEAEIKTDNSLFIGYRNSNVPSVS